MDPFTPNDAAAELVQVVTAVLGDAAEYEGQSAAEKVAWLCAGVWLARDSYGTEVAQSLTFRSLVRLLDSVYRLWCIRAMELPEALSAAYGATIKGLFKDARGSNFQDQFDKDLEQKFGRPLRRDTTESNPAALALRELMDGASASTGTCSLRKQGARGTTSRAWYPVALTARVV